MIAAAPLRICADQVLAFRLASHNLATRLAPGCLCVAAGACGVQNTPPGSAALALHARIIGLTPGDLDRALVEEKTLLQAWSLRAAPHLFPTTDAAVFTLGLLPIDEESAQFFIRGAEPALDKIGISATEVIELTAAALYEELAGQSLTKKQLGTMLAARVSQRLTVQQLASWQLPSWYAPDQTLGESIVRFALPVVALRGLCCHAHQRGNQAYLACTDQWLGAARPQQDREEAGAELVRRYLHCFGPSTAEHLAEWAGIAPAQATRAWELVKHELAEISFDGRKAWLREQDLVGLMSPPMPTGIRFLPPHDPYLQLRDRTTLIPEKALHRYVWRHAGNPGIILANGRIVGMWRGKKGKRGLTVTAELFTAVSPSIRSEIEAEATALAPYWGCERAQAAVTIAGSRPRSVRPRELTDSCEPDL